MWPSGWQALIDVCVRKLRIGGVVWVIHLIEDVDCRFIFLFVLLLS